MNLIIPAVALAFFLFTARPFQGFLRAQQKQYCVPSQHPPNKETAESFYCYRPCLAQVTQRVTGGRQGSLAQSSGGMSSHSK